MSLKKAAILNGISRVSKILIQLLVNAVLARIISPEEYGVITVITVFSTFFNTFADMGFGAAIIQNKDLNKEDINIIYSFTIYLSLVLSGFFCLISVPISSFYGDAVYLILGPILSISLMFNTISMVPNSVLMRDKRFVTVAIRTIVVYCGGGLAAILLAKSGFSYYSIVIQTDIIAAVSFFWNYFSIRPVFRLRLKRESLNKVMAFSMYQFAFNVINYFSRNLDNLLTGKYLGNDQLGYYDKAYTLMLYPVNNLTGIVSPVLHPILSDFQNDKNYLYKSYVKISRIMAFIGIYVSAYCFMSSEELIQIVFGPQWIKSAPCFQILGTVVCFQMINSVSASIFQSLGNTKLLFINGGINAFFSIIMIVLGLSIGKTIIALSLCVAIAYVFHFFSAQFMIMKFGFNYKLSFFVENMKKEICLYIMMMLVCSFFPFSPETLIASAFSKLMWATGFYLILALMTGELRDMFSLINEKKL